MNQDVTNQLPAEVKKQNWKKLKRDRKWQEEKRWKMEFQDKMNMCDKIYYRIRKKKEVKKEIK